MINIILLMLSIYCYCIFKHVSVIPEKAMYSYQEWNTYLPQLKKVEQNWITIRDEYQKIKPYIQPIYKDVFFNTITTSTKWKRFYIKRYAPIHPQIKKILPQTCKMIESIPSIRMAMFSILLPGAVIKPHRGIYKGVIRAHLGLSCPKSCILYVDGQLSEWENGKMKVWDDTYTHFVVNRSKHERVILFIDIHRPIKLNLKIIKFRRECEKFIQKMFYLNAK